MTDKEIEALIDMARKTHTGEMSFAEFAARLRFELKRLPDKEQDRQHETP
jgi:hypothetical protein